MIETIEITKQEYFNLRKSSEILNRLENGGVDNWDWYSDSIYDENLQDFDEFEEELKEEIWGKKNID